MLEKVAPMNDFYLSNQRQICRAVWKIGQTDHIISKCIFD